ncbi:MAG: hypothetical protein J0H97_15095 [Alphaproteobacteria bacterium]|jgi:nitrous oxide reductase accessory protein NosL|nr:hypothetical protein [Alphaproteobacteria bacterium]
MKIATFVVLGATIMAAGCSFRSETVQPAPAPTTQRTTTVYSGDPYTPSTTTTTVTTPAR